MKKEGDQKTPKGKFKFTLLLYRKDQDHNFDCKIKKKVIRKNMGWCDDPKSNNYNKLINFPFKYSAERLYLKKNTYDLILVLDFNTKPIRKRAEVQFSFIFQIKTLRSYKRMCGNKKKKKTF